MLCNNDITQKMAAEMMDLSKSQTIINKKYYDFGPTFACEKLREKHGIKISVKSIRKLMIKEGLWKDRKHKQVIVHQMRSRRSRFGDLI